MMGVFVVSDDVSSIGRVIAVTARENIVSIPVEFLVIH